MESNIWIQMSPKCTTNKGNQINKFSSVWNVIQLHLSVIWASVGEMAMCQCSIGFIFYFFIDIGNFLWANVIEGHQTGIFLLKTTYSRWMSYTDTWNIVMPHFFQYYFIWYPLFKTVVSIKSHPMACCDFIVLSMLLLSAMMTLQILILVRNVCDLQYCYKRRTYKYFDLQYCWKERT